MFGISCYLAIANSPNLVRLMMNIDDTMNPPAEPMEEERKPEEGMSEEVASEEVAAEEVASEEAPSEEAPQE